MRITEKIYPRSLVETIRIHDKRIAIPFTRCIAPPARQICVFSAARAAIGPDRSKRVTPLEHLVHAIGKDYQFHGIGIERIARGIPLRIASLIGV